MADGTVYPVTFQVTFSDYNIGPYLSYGCCIYWNNVPALQSFDISCLQCIL